MGSGRGRLGWVLAAALSVAIGAAPAHAGDVVAIYAAYWAGLPAAEIRLRLRDGDAAYHDEIEISTKGLPPLFTHFRTTASAEGRLAAVEAFYFAKTGDAAFKEAVLSRGARERILREARRVEAALSARGGDPGKAAR